MTQHVLRRLLSMLLICLAIAFFCSLGLRLMRHAPGRSLPGHVVDATRDTLSYLRRIPSGDLGTTYRTVGRRRIPVAVSSVLGDTYVKSMGLLLVSLVMAALVGAAAGIAGAVWEGSAFSLAVLTSTLLGVSLPTFFAALLLQVLEIQFYQRTGTRLVPVGGYGWDRHLILPALVLAARPLAQISRITYLSLTEAAGQDYVRTARAKGLPGRTVWLEHILPNAAVPILTSLGVSLRYSLGSLPVVELFFGWPGLGAGLLTAVRSQQTTLVISSALALGLTFMVVNLLLELANRAVDPRLRVVVDE